MKLSDLLWGGLGVVGVALGGVELSQGKYLLATSAMAVGAALIVSTAVTLARKPRG